MLFDGPLLLQLFFLLGGGLFSSDTVIVNTKIELLHQSCNVRHARSTCYNSKNVGVGTRGLRGLYPPFYNNGIVK